MHRRMPIVLAVILWGAALGADAADMNDRIWRPLLTVAGIATIAVMVHRYSRRSEALARAVLTRPLNGSDSGPLPRIEVISPRGPEHWAPVRPSAAGKHRGQHASRV